MTAHATWFEFHMSLRMCIIYQNRLPAFLRKGCRQKCYHMEYIYVSAFPCSLHTLRSIINLLIWPALHWILTGIMLLYNSTLIKGGCTCSVPVRRMMLWILRGERGRSIWFCAEESVRIVGWELGFTGWTLGHLTEGGSIWAPAIQILNNTRAPISLSIFKNRRTNMNKL